MLDAIIFDFDGVVVDSEPIHLASFREVLARRDINLTTEEYYGKYIGFDDHDCFVAVLKDNGRKVNERLVAAMTAEKSLLVKKAFAESIEPLPGALELMRAARRAGAGLAICSGALREEIMMAGKAVGAIELTDVVVSAEDVSAGKPDPQGYRLAMKLLRERLSRPINPSATWVVEDTPAGVEAAKKAGPLKVLAVTNSYNRDSLAAADRVVASLTEVTLADLGRPKSEQSKNPDTLEKTKE